MLKYFHKPPYHNQLISSSFYSCVMYDKTFETRVTWSGRPPLSRRISVVRIYIQHASRAIGTRKSSRCNIYSYPIAFCFLQRSSSTIDVSQRVLETTFTVHRNVIYTKDPVAVHRGPRTLKLLEKVLYG